MHKGCAWLSRRLSRIYLVCAQQECMAELAVLLQCATLVKDREHAGMSPVPRLSTHSHIQENVACTLAHITRVPTKRDQCACLPMLVQIMRARMPGKCASLSSGVGCCMRPAACAWLSAPLLVTQLSGGRASLSSRSSGTNCTRVPARSGSGWRLMAVIWPQSGLASSFFSSARPCASVHHPLCPTVVHLQAVNETLTLS